MTSRGRGRGGTAASANNDRSSSSSTQSSRSSSLTSMDTRTTNTRDTDQLMKQLTAQLKGTTGTVVAPKIVPKKIGPNLATSKQNKTASETTVNGSTSNANQNLDQWSANKKRDQNTNQRPNSSRGGHHESNRGRNMRDNFVQLEGILQAHPQSSMPSGSSSSFSSRVSSGKRESSSHNTTMPNLKKLGTSKTTVIGDVDGLKYEIDEEYQPRQIPIADKRSVFDVKQEPNLTTKIKESVPTSSEKIDSFIKLFSEQNLQTTSKSIVKDEPIEPTDLPKSPSDSTDASQLILMQFPDVLPCVRPSSSSEKPELASLRDLPDGFLGKLQIYKSGRCRLKLNDDTYLDVDVGQSASFLQNVMVTEMASSTMTQLGNDHENNNDMNKLICLGDIKHKLVVSLDVDHVLKDTRQ